jgi:hypothetical protein
MSISSSEVIAHTVDERTHRPMILSDAAMKCRDANDAVQVAIAKLFTAGAALTAPDELLPGDEIAPVPVSDDNASETPSSAWNASPRTLNAGSRCMSFARLWRSTMPNLLALAKTAGWSSTARDVHKRMRCTSCKHRGARFTLDRPRGCMS